MCTCSGLALLLLGVFVVIRRGAEILLYFEILCLLSPLVPSQAILWSPASGPAGEACRASGKAEGGQGGE